MKSFLSRHYESFGLTVLVILVLSLFVASGTMAATYEQEQQSLYQAAKTEGKVILYTSGDTVEMQKMLKAFETRYPGIKTELYRAGSGTVLEKLMSEHEAKIYSADVLFFHAGFAWPELKKKGMLMRYDSPVYGSFPKNGIDPGYTISTRNLGTFIAYNTNLVPAQVVAKTKTFEDWVKLAEQKEYRDRFGSQDLATGGGIESVFTILSDKGEEKGKGFYRRLFAAGMRMSQGGADQLNAVVSGQEAFDFFVPSQRFAAVIEKGAPVKAAVLSDGQPVHLSPMSIYAKAPHPNAAKMLFNWFNSMEGQTLIVEVTGNYSLLPGTPTPKGFPAVKDMKVIQVPMAKWEEMGRRTDELIQFIDQLKKK
ncbi:MAG: Fe(3+) transporter substrate-binding protein [Deltaproteobacteria bacterium]|nr:Fe(3+) transporter substrate-binding protein [Deltaproteobacteria bacterium]